MSAVSALAGRLTLLTLCLLISSASFAAEVATDVRNYDQDPRHLWNRLHQTLFVRTGPDGTSYGQDRLDPLYWGETRNLLEVDSHRQALEVLDEFLKKHGEKLIDDPLKRAFLQHDLWALFDWSASPRTGHYDPQRRELQLRLAPIIRRLALSGEELASLPDNYARAVAANAPTSLPRGLFRREGDWVNLSVGSGTAPQHVQSFDGRSTFHVLLRLSEGRAATLAYLERLRAFERPWIFVESPVFPNDLIVMNPDMPQFPAGTEWALVRRMRVIDRNGSIRPTPIIESIQLRRYVAVPPAGGFASREESTSAQQAFEFIASRVRGGNLREVLAGERDFRHFQSHSNDPFELSAESLARFRERQVADPFRTRMQHDVLRDCHTCHSAPGVHSVQSLAHIVGHRSLSAPTLTESDPDQVLSETVYWSSYRYGLLRGLWER